MSKKHYKHVEPREEIVNEVEVVEAIAAVEETFEEPVVVEKIKMGKVEGCTKLNVRKRPMADADVVCIIDRGTELEIDVKRSTAKFYRICTASGIEGYCVKEFISVN